MGRPPRIDRATIARAADEIGLDRLSMRSVAEHLGVSVPGLYHYVEGREDLLRLAAERLVAKIALPEDTGQHWARWLFQWAQHVGEVFVATPVLLEYFLRGVVGPDRMADQVDEVVGLLVRRGFTARDALDAFFLVTECAIGLAAGTIRLREITRREPGPAADLADLLRQRAFADREPGELPYLREAAGAGPVGVRGPADGIRTILAGIAARRGESGQAVEELGPAGQPHREAT